MALGVQALQEYEVKIGTIANVAVDCRGWLEPSELLATVSAPTVVEAASGLTFANQAVSIAAKVINGQSVPIGMAAQFRVDATAGVALVDAETLLPVPYTLVLTASTNSTPAQTRKVELLLTVVT